MSEQVDDKKVTVKMLKESLADLRFGVSEFQESISEYLSAVEQLWTEVKSHLASIEARLAGLEVQLSAIPEAPEWPQEKIDEMLNDLKEVGAEISKMRWRFRSFAQGSHERVN